MREIGEEGLGMGTGRRGSDGSGRRGPCVLLSPCPWLLLPCLRLPPRGLRFCITSVACSPKEMRDPTH